LADLEAWATQLKRGTLDLCVLKVLRTADAHGYEIVQRLKEARLLTIREATVYPVLQRLLRDGLLRSHRQKSSMGPPRKCFSLTRKGKDVLQEMESQWAILVRNVDSLH
jgi:PadR family transcriptional regulator PadR